MSVSRKTLLWLQSASCGGCTASWLCASGQGALESLKTSGIDLLWHPSLSICGEDELLALLEACLSGQQRLDILCVEGALLRGPGDSGRFHLFGGGRPMIDWVRDLAVVAGQVVAVGTCAAFGGIQSASGNPLGACGLQFEGEQQGGALGADYRPDRLPVVNITGCPPHPHWVIDTLMALGLDAFTRNDLDPLSRPRFYADHLVHHGCDRNEYYEFKASAEKASDLGCLMENMGCVGTQAHADCNIRPWNGEGSCTKGGYACIGCTEPGFEDPGHPFARTPKVAGIPVGLPTDMPKAWFVALASLSKSATPKRVKQNAVADHVVVPPAVKPRGSK